MSRSILAPPTAPLLADGAKMGGWWHDERGETGRVICDLCPRACALRPGDRGFCFVRENRDGQMVLDTYGRSTGFCIDPIEKKPLNHFYPGTSVLSFGTAGCNLGCKFCQNWDISKSREVERLSELATPDMIAEAAVNHGCRSVAFTYNDPVIWAEYAIDTARACRARGLRTVAVTAGYITPEARGEFFSAMDAANVDLKAFTEQFYQHLTLSHLAPVLDTLRWLKHETDVWFEVTNLIIPGENDSTDELERMCDWYAANLGPDVPLHFTAFHPDFRMRDKKHTPHETLAGAYEIARARGLRYVYVGNVDDLDRQSTVCPGCAATVIERNWYELGRYRVANGACAECGTSIAGRFENEPGAWGRKRLPVSIARFQPSNPQPSLVSLTSNRVRRAHSREEQRIVGNPTAGASSTADDPDDKFENASGEMIAARSRAVLAAAAATLASCVTGEPVMVGEPSRRLLASATCDGAFVTLRRSGNLRACCGFLGARTAIDEAIERAATRTASDDVRFPAISPSELPYLTLDVWLLGPPRPVPGPASARSRVIQIGRDGLQVIRGEQRGLLLPSVAIEHRLDAEAFLDHVCLKAGLPASAWRDEETQLFTFAGEVVEAPLADYLPAALCSSSGAASGHLTRNELGFTREEIDALVRYARANIVAHLGGATPSYYLPGVPDANVQGVALGVVLPEANRRIDLMQLVLRPTVPLQGTLFGMCQATASLLAQERISAAEAAVLPVEVTVLDDPAMHGGLASPDIRGFESATRAWLAIEGQNAVLAYQPALDASKSLSATARLLRGDETGVEAEGAALYSLRAQSSAAQCIVVDRPRGHRGPELRPPAVAGRFYPADPAEVRETVAQLFDGLPIAKPSDRPWSAVMLPHAGWVYSGRIAAQGLSEVAIGQTVVVLGPKHTALGVSWAVAPNRVWQLPGGDVAGDPIVAADLARSVRGWQLDAVAHQREHAIEVELPLVRHLAPNVRALGVALGGASWAQCRQWGLDLATWARRQPQLPLWIVSSDMNHFANDAETRRLDAIALDVLESLEPERAFEVIRARHISMCGLVPAVVVMTALAELGQLTRVRRVAYGTSADACGDTSRCVGYAAMLWG